MASEAKTSPSGKRKWAFRLVVLSVVAGLCLGVGLTQTDWGRDRMRDLAVKALHDELGLEAEFGQLRIDLNAWPPGVEVVATDIVLDDAVYGRFVEAKGLVIRPSLQAFLRGELDLEQIAIEEPTIYLVIRDGEVRNLPRPRTEASGPVHLPFSLLTATSARVIVDAQPWADAVLEGLELEMVVTEGDRIALNASAEGGEVEHLLGTEAITSFVLDGGVDPDNGFELRRFVLATPHVSVSATDAEVPLPFDGTFAGEVGLRVDLAHIVNLPIGIELPPLEGEMQVHANVNGTADGPVGQGDVRLTRVSIDGYGLGEVCELAVDFDPHEIRIPEARLPLIREGGVVTLTASLGLGEGFPLDAQVGIEHMQMAKLMEQLSVTPNAIVQWDMSGQGRLRGTLDPLNLVGPIRLRTRDFNITMDAWHARPARHVMTVERANIGGTWSIRPDGLRFENLEGETPRSRILASALIGFDNQLRVVASTPRVDLADISPLLIFDMAGTGYSSVDVSGTFDDPVVTGHVRIDGFGFAGFPLGDMVSDFVMEEEGLAVRFPEVRAEKRDSEYRIDDLYLDFSDDRVEITGDVRTPRIHLADLYHTFHFEGDERFEAIQGHGSGRMSLHYTMGFPTDGENGTFDTDIDIDIAQAEVAGFAYENGELQANWHWVDWTLGPEGGVFRLDRMHLTKGEGTLTMAGRMDLGQRLHFTAAADQLAFRDTEGLRDSLPEVGGIYNLAAEVRGTVARPRVDMEVGITGLTYDGALIGDGRTYVRLTDRSDPWVQAARSWDPRNPPEGEPCAHARAGFAGGARWRPDPPLNTSEGRVPGLAQPMAYLVCGGSFDGSIDVDMAFGWTAVYPTRGLVTLAGFPLDTLLSQSGGDVTGVLSGTVFLEGGAMMEDDSYVGEVRLSELSVDAGQVSLANRGDVEVNLNGRGFEVAHALFVGAGSQLSVSGDGLAKGGLALTATGSVDLGLLATLSPTVSSAHGTVDVEVNIRGASDDPAIFGEATVADAGFRFANFPSPLDELNGRVTFSAHRVIFEDFTARTAGGQLALAGSANLRDGGLEAYSFDVDAHNLYLAPEDGLDVSFDAQGHLAWDRSRRLPLLSGEVRLGRVRYTKDIQLSPTIGQLNRAQRAEVEQYDPELDGLDLDIRIQTPRGIRIENNLFDGEIAIDDSERAFRIVGTDQRFGVVGRLTIPRGILRLRSSNLDVREADIVFEDQTRIDPRFDITAVTQIRRTFDPNSPDWRIGLRAHGTMDGFQLDLTSEPQMSQEDIMLLLTLGMTRNEAQQLQAGDFTGAGVELLSEVSGVDEEVTRAVGIIDEFGITTVYSELTGRPEPHLSVGKRISERVRLSASTGLSAESREIRASVDWQVGDQTSIQAVYDNADTTDSAIGSNVGVDFRWRLEFD